MMNYGLKDKIVLITGANNPLGIGAKTVKLFSEQGAAVAVVYKKTFEDFSTLKSRKYGLDKYRKYRNWDHRYIESVLKKYSGRYFVMEIDLTEKNAEKLIFDKVEDKLGKVEILINNASEYEENNDTVFKINSTIIDKIFEVNVKSTLLMMKEFIFRNKNEGRIINISTDAAQNFPGQIAYGSSKACIEALTRSIAMEVGEFGITVNCIAPGPTQTGYIDKQLEEELIKSIPLRRIGRPDDIANTILFLASDKASWITGNVIRVSGGHYI